MTKITERNLTGCQGLKNGSLFDAPTPGYFHVVNLSGGKDSSAMLILMIEKGMPIDSVLNADTGMEFPEMYEHLAKMYDYLYRERGLHITTLRHPKGFEWLMFEEPKVKPSAVRRRLQEGVPLYGNGWPGFKVRWCTGQLKIRLLTKEAGRLKGDKHALHYVGIAADETRRCGDGQYPLVEWGISEEEALRICYGRGFDFGGLYRTYRRVSYTTLFRSHTAAFPAGAALFKGWTRSAG